MDIIIKETGARELLEILDPNTGVDWIQDFIGNYDAFSDGQFIWDEEQDAYLCDQVTFDWWAKVVADHELLENRIFELYKEYGDKVYDVIIDAGNVDLEDHAAAMNAALDEAFPM